MAMRRPTMRLKRADLPTFGRPTMAMSPGTQARWCRKGDCESKSRVATSASGESPERGWTRNKDVLDIIPFRSYESPKMKSDGEEERRAMPSSQLAPMSPFAARPGLPGGEGERFHLGYRPTLDGLRGVAILAVVATHAK